MEEITSFEQFKLNKQLLTAIADAGYTNPTPIQQKAIPAITAGHDIFGIAQTGTGKTAAFLLPILMKIKYAQGDSPRAIILTPTRELAMQIDEHISLLGKNTDIRHTAIYGGVGMKAQVEKVKAGLDILVATPGRLMDVYFTGELYLRNIQVMVLDEADKMMDMGFMPQIRKLLEILPRKRQNLLFSATLPEKVVKLSEEFLEFPTRIEITPQATPVDTVTQILYHVPNLRTKINLLCELLLNEEEFKKVIIFCRTRINAENIYKYLDRKVTNSVKVIHANKQQSTRINAIEEFKNNDIRILVATDVASRGIDVSLVSHVINFDIPIVYEDYVHRIGRTGRAYNKGTAISFCNKAEEYHIAKIEQLIRMPIPVTPLPDYLEITETPFEEKQAMLMEIDKQKRKENPNFKGAFHETKQELKRKAQKQQLRKANRPKKGRMID